MQFVAYAVVHEDPPEVYVAENLEVLHHVLALEVVGATPAADLAPGPRKRLQEALLEERWGDAVADWIDLTGVPVDVYDGLRIWTTAAIADPELRAAELQFAPLFQS